MQNGPNFGEATQGYYKSSIRVITFSTIKHKKMQKNKKFAECYREKSLHNWVFFRQKKGKEQLEEKKGP